MKILKKYVRFGMSWLWFSFVVIMGYALHYFHQSDESVLMVQPDKIKDFHATLYAYHKDKHGWHSDFALPVVVGAGGIKPSEIYLPLLWFYKREGDRATPSGSFRIASLFGRPGGIDLIATNFHSITSSTFYGDDPFDHHYNEWSKYTNSGEKMRRDDQLYDIGMEINYNHDPVLPFHGSAIFIHIWRNANSPTAGCIAMSKNSITRVVEWMQKQQEITMTIRCL